MGEMFIWSKLGQNPSEIDGALNHATCTVHFRYVTRAIAIIQFVLMKRCGVYSNP